MSKKRYKSKHNLIISIITLIIILAIGFYENKNEINTANNENKRT